MAQQYLDGISAGAAIAQLEAAIKTEKAPVRVYVGYGFWIFILSDIVMFSGLFAAYAVLSGNTAGGPTGLQLFNLRRVYIETMCLLVSSFTCGLGALSAERRQPGRFLIFAAFTFVLGAAFLFIEGSEFSAMISRGAGPSRSGFLSAFFTLVGTHGVHVTSGLIWLIYLVAQVIAFRLLELVGVVLVMVTLPRLARCPACAWN